MRRRKALWVGAGLGSAILTAVTLVPSAAAYGPRVVAQAVPGPFVARHVLASDGCVVLPDRTLQASWVPGTPEPPGGFAPDVGLGLITTGALGLPGPDLPCYYVFGFKDVDQAIADGEIPPGGALEPLRGTVQLPAPYLSLNEGEAVDVKVSDIGLAIRVDLTDPHTLHYHGFPNATAIYDGVPQVSFAIPINRDFTYRYNIRQVGSYMWHCHVEDTEHVQMGMSGPLVVHPAQNGTPEVFVDPLTGATRTFTQFAYNDGDGHSGYQTEQIFFLTDFWAASHETRVQLGEEDWTTFDPDWALLNGRAYPETAYGSADPADPMRTRLVVDDSDGADDVVLFRMISLAYLDHDVALFDSSGTQVTAVWRTVGADAKNVPDGHPLSTLADSVLVGAGEAYDAILDTSALSPGLYTLRDLNPESPTPIFTTLEVTP